MKTLTRRLWPLTLALVLGLAACPGRTSPGDPPSQNPPPEQPPVESPPPVPPTSKGQWTRWIAIPEPVAEASAASVGDKLYLVDKARHTWVFDAMAGTWSTPASLTYPVSVDHTSLVAVQASVYAIGGLKAWGGLFPSTDAVYRLDTLELDKGWQPTGKNLPYARGAHAAVAVGSRIFVFGGIGRPDDGAARDLDQALVLDTASPGATWQVLEPLSAARDHLTAQAVGGKVYAIGGRQARESKGGLEVDVSGVQPEVDVYDAQTGKRLGLVAELPKPRGGLGSAALKGQIVVFGGEGDAAQVDGALPGKNVFDLTQIYDPVSNTWREGTPMLTARHGVAAAVVKSQAHAIGGGLTMYGDDNATQANEAFELP